MLEVILTGLFQLIESAIKLRPDKTSRFIQGYLRLYWAVESIEKDSELFIDGLDVILKENRYPARLEQALCSIYENIDEIIEILNSERMGFGIHFWELMDLVLAKDTRTELGWWVNAKLSRLAAWHEFLQETKDYVQDPSASKRMLQLTRKFSTEEYKQKLILLDRSRDLEEFIEAGEIEPIDINNPRHLRNAYKEAKKTLTRIKKFRKEMAVYIKENFEIKEILNSA